MQVQATETERKSMALFALALNYGKEMPEPLLVYWMRLLEPYQPSVVERAVSQVIAEYEYKTLPPFAVLLKAIKAQSGQVEPERGLACAADMEWEKVQEAIRKYGIYETPGFCEITERVIRYMGGWVELCNAKEEYQHLKRKDFVEKWKQFAENKDLMALGTDRILELTEGVDRGQTVTERHHLSESQPSTVGSLISSLGMFTGMPRAAMQ